MFPFKKKPAPAAEPCANEQINRKLDETHARLDETVRSMQRRLVDRPRRRVALVVIK